eukprot:gene5060-5164_t
MDTRAMLGMGSNLGAQLGLEVTPACRPPLPTASRPGLPVQPSGAVTGADSSHLPNPTVAH